MMAYPRFLVAACLLVATAFATDNLAIAQPLPHRDRRHLGKPDITFLGADGQKHPGFRCGTREGVPSSIETPAELAALRADGMDAVLESMKFSPVVIPILWHVVHCGNDDIGKLPRADIEEQMRVLNDAYVQTGFSFTLTDVDYTDNCDFYHKCWDVEARMKKQLNADPRTTLNMYTCDPGEGTLGWATMPRDLKRFRNVDGVVIMSTSLPGGTAAPYNLGHTAVHEVGHWLGLLHTFGDDGGCDSVGDEVADTPAEADAAYDCDAGRNSCPRQPGNDPVHNYLDYTPDACMTHFTPGQVSRMQRKTFRFRRQLFAQRRAELAEMTAAGAGGNIAQQQQLLQQRR